MMASYSISGIRRELIARFERLVRTRARALGIGSESFRGWVDGIVGEGIALAIAHQDRWDPRKRDDFLYWCFLKSRSLIRDALKRESTQQKLVRRLRTLAPTEPGRRAYPDTRAMHEEVMGILEQLTPTEQKALVLFYLAGMSARRLGELLGKTPKAAHELVRRARLKASRLATPGPVQQKAKAPLTAEERERKKAQQEEVLERLFRLAEPSEPD